MVKQLADLISNLEVEIIDPVVIKGYPKDEDFQVLDKLAAAIAVKHEALNM
jgi:hypothetical protein